MPKLEDIDRDYDTLSLEQLKQKYGDSKALRDLLRQSKKWNVENSLTKRYLTEHEAEDANEQIQPQDSHDASGSGLGDRLSEEPNLKYDKSLEKLPEKPEEPVFKADAFKPKSVGGEYQQNSPAPLEEMQKEARADNPYDNNAYKKELNDRIANEAPGLYDDPTKRELGPHSILQDYYAGRIDKGTRDYYIADALAKFARNTGKDIGNIGAQFSGGTINNNYETPAYDAVAKADQDRMLDVEANKLKGSTQEQNYRGGEANITGKNIENRVNSLKKEGSETFDRHRSEWQGRADELKKAGKGEEAFGYQVLADMSSLITSQAAGEMGTEEYAALAALESIASNPSAAKDILDDMRKAVAAGMSAVSAVTGAIGEASEAVAGLFDRDGSNAQQIAAFTAKHPEFKDKVAAPWYIKKAQELRPRKENYSLKEAMDVIEEEYQNKIAPIEASAGWYKK